MPTWRRLLSGPTTHSGPAAVAAAGVGLLGARRRSADAGTHLLGRIDEEVAVGLEGGVAVGVGDDRDVALLQLGGELLVPLVAPQAAPAGDDGGDARASRGSRGPRRPAGRWACATGVTRCTRPMSLAASFGWP